MYCKACGKQIPDDSAFCNKCGASQRAGLAAPSSETRWETCEIDYETVNRPKLRKWEYRFVVNGIGPKGKIRC